MEYSPKLKKAMEQIKAILKDNDIAASVILHSPGFSEYLLHINTTYSCAKFEGDSIRIRAKLEDFNGNRAAQKRKLEDTVNMITHFSETGGRVSMQFFDLLDVVKRYVDIDSSDGNHSSHNTQNN